MDIPNQGGGDSDVLILYQRIEALPKRYHDFSETIPSFDHEINGAKEALEHCDYVNVILTDHGKARNQCWAIVPQYESYYIQKWMRIPEQRPAGTKHNDNIVDHSYPLRLVGRGVKSSGHTDFESPEIKDMRRNWDLLLNYFQAFEDVIKELKPLVQKVATPKKTVTVMVSNFGQSELLVNFVCAAKSRGLDTSSILVFATDMETKALADHLGLTAFYDERVSINLTMSMSVVVAPALGMEQWNMESLLSHTTYVSNRSLFVSLLLLQLCIIYSTTLLYHTLLLRCNSTSRTLVPCLVKLQDIMAIASLLP